ncbi:uncharacterized protein N7473_007806 [Penicillium subrubescens]|uniref:AB hydrolase-1 domain-containing protein n=1 Tax=Penicillium subrubescens TaxID=1316194 RepID=A0A1Q5TJT2_9EURO|nr:uncharacterized protein N7473_007806 [Penicillium subrubescens]KAJ5891578.1 hypothetical protein N7473_007806 [Penicillium subrubescens]OKP00483.1 hypothetical protein PENSUB_7940 [Penicillium subrubescens]
MAKPTIVFAPGAWYPPTVFDGITKKLNEHGYNCHTIAFPSIQQATTVQDLRPDIAAVRAIVEPEVNAGREVIIVSHSWSGLPVASALDGLERSDLENAGKKGGVIKLVYLAAFIPQVGESLISAFGGTPPPWYVLDEQNGTVTASDPFALFFHDVPNGQEWAQTLRPHAWSTKNSPATSAAYMKIPSLYLLCVDDFAIPLAVQQLMVDRAQRKGASIETEKINAGHSPWLVRPDEVVAHIRKQAGEEF